MQTRPESRKLSFGFVRRRCQTELEKTVRLLEEGRFINVEVRDGMLRMIASLSEAAVAEGMSVGVESTACSLEP